MDVARMSTILCGSASKNQMNFNHCTLHYVSYFRFWFLEFITFCLLSFVSARIVSRKRRTAGTVCQLPFWCLAVCCTRSVLQAAVLWKRNTKVGTFSGPRFCFVHFGKWSDLCKNPTQENITSKNFVPFFACCVCID